MVFRFALPMRGGSISSILTLTCPRFSTRCLMQSGTQNRMAQRELRRIVFPMRDELLAAARERVDLPPGKLWLDYQGRRGHSLCKAQRKDALYSQQKQP